MLQFCPCGASFNARKRKWCSVGCKNRKANARYYSAERKRKQATLLMAFADAAKASGCVDCGNKNLSVLDLDHVRGQKTMAVSALAWKKTSLRKFFAELDKCEPRCANCHRLATLERQRRAA